MVGADTVVGAVGRIAAPCSAWCRRSHGVAKEQGMCGGRWETKRPQLLKRYRLLRPIATHCAYWIVAKR